MRPYFPVPDTACLIEVGRLDEYAVNQSLLIAPIGGEDSRRIPSFPGGELGIVAMLQLEDLAPRLGFSGEPRLAVYRYGSRCR